ncbi:MAG: hypothetical protein KDC71_24305, partial [Acidobacteria bacterium]|nr:hypothetical protein [Acidobacteriota bacterium]
LVPQTTQPQEMLNFKDGEEETQSISRFLTAALQVGTPFSLVIGRIDLRLQKIQGNLLKPIYKE